jgi:hypothetical protein
MVEKRKKKVNKLWIILPIAFALIAVGIGAYFLFFYEIPGTGDITNPGSSSSLIIRFYDAAGNVIGDLNDLKKTQSVFQSIVKPTSPASCTTRTNCNNYAANPNIICWNSQCVLGNVAAMDMAINITNPSSSQVAFNNVGVKSATPAGLYTAMNKSIISTLNPGQSALVGTTTPLSVTSFSGTQAFQVVVNGTNSYTGQVSEVTGSISLVFASDPTGGLNVVLISPI